MIKTMLQDWITTSTFTFAVYRRNQFMPSARCFFTGSNGGDHAVFAVAADSAYYIQISKWYKYRGAAVRKLQKIVASIEH